jgi:hypothetical protein
MDDKIIFVLQSCRAMTLVTMSTRHVSVRLSGETIARVDALGPQFSTPYRPATRSDVLRALILSALASREREAAPAAREAAAPAEGEPGEGPRRIAKPEPG